MYSTLPNPNVVASELARVKACFALTSDGQLTLLVQLLTLRTLSKFEEGFLSRMLSHSSHFLLAFGKCVFCETASCRKTHSDLHMQ